MGACCENGDAALTMPRAFIAGQLIFGLKSPITCASPLMSASCAWAVIITWGTSSFCGCHVPAQLPSFSDVSDNGSSRLENVVIIDPSVTGLPQLSTTYSSIGTASPARAKKSEPIFVNTGNNTSLLHGLPPLLDNTND